MLLGTLGGETVGSSSIGPFEDILCWEQELASVVGWAYHPLVQSEAPEVSADMWRRMYANIGVVLSQYAQIEDGLRRLAIHLDSSVGNHRKTMRQWLICCEESCLPRLREGLQEAFENPGSPRNTQKSHDSWEPQSWSRPISRRSTMGTCHYVLGSPANGLSSRSAFR